MSRAVYSAKLAAADFSTSGPHSLFTVPPNFVYVVRDVALSVQTGSGVSIVLEDLTAGHGFYTTPALTAPQSDRWQGMQVFEAGDSFGVYVISGEWFVRVSGYKLTA